VALLSNNQTMHEMAVKHATRTMQEHIRDDGSSYHIVEYDETDGSVIKKYTGQGYADWSTWSRGQAWAVYGFTVAFRYTLNMDFLRTAVRAAQWFISHLDETSDHIPYWDLLAPYNTSYQPRDTSAAVILSSALLELTDYTGGDLRALFLETAFLILGNLTTPKSEYYIGNHPLKLPAILLNATAGPYHGPNNTSVYNAAESYGDYYFTEAITRLERFELGLPIVELPIANMKQTASSD